MLFFKVFFFPFLFLSKFLIFLFRYDPSRYDPHGYQGMDPDEWEPEDERPMRGRRGNFSSKVQWKNKKLLLLLFKPHIFCYVVLFIFYFYFHEGPPRSRTRSRPTNTVSLSNLLDNSEGVDPQYAKERKEFYQNLEGFLQRPPDVVTFVCFFGI